LKNIYIAFLIALLFVGCNENVNDNPESNKAPETFLFLHVDEGLQLSQQKSRLSVHWWGDDPDGLVAGYFFKWEGIDDNWTFTTKNDSVFALPIGTVDTTFNFVVVAMDSEGNGIYDSQIIQNNINFGPEPFTDLNKDGIYNKGEPFIDLGLADPTPASQKFPIKNTAPTIEWDEVSVLPLQSFPVVTVGWNFDDLDGVESITKINVALNDTSKFVSLPRSTRYVTLIVDDFKSANPSFRIFLNGSHNDEADSKLENLVLNGNNRLYVQAVDISGSKSKFVSLPEKTKNWYVKKPKDSFLVVDDYAGNTPNSFYDNLFKTVKDGALIDKVDFLDVETTEMPYKNITFIETLKLFKYVYWYGDSEPSLDLLNLVTQKYVENGGKIAFSLTFQDSSANFPLDLSSLQNFLPIEKLDQKKPLNFLLPAADVVATDQASGYPNIKTAATISFVRTYRPSSTANTIYNLSSKQLNGTISFINNDKNIFFIGLPLNQCDGNTGSVKQLFEKVFFDEFGFGL
jgi:hypothetical protein